jgi:hypothetical protein
MSDKPAKWLVRSIAQKKALKKSGIWRKQARSKISALVADVTPEIMNADALLGVDAEWDALDILFDQSTDELAKRKMVERINILEREHTILSEKKLHQAWDLYKQSAQIGKAAEQLRGAAAEIEESAKTITKLASLLGAITKFVGALKQT